MVVLDAAGYKTLVATWSVDAAGGPSCYPGRDMATAHRGLNIDNAGFDAVATERSTPP